MQDRKPMPRRTLFLSLSTFLFIMIHQPARAENYTIKGEDGSANTLDFANVSKFGPFVKYTYKTIINHDPKWQVPANYYENITTMIGNCDNQTSAPYSWQILDSSGTIIGHGEPNRRPLQFSHWPDSDTLLLGAACKQMKSAPAVVERTDEAGSTPGKSDTASSPTYAEMLKSDRVTGAVAGRGYTEFRDKGVSAQVDNTGKGAVLCIWGIDNALIEIGKQCFRKNDDVQRELIISERRMDDFIIRNSARPVSQSQLDARRADGLKQLPKGDDMCKGEGAELYQRVRSGGAAALHASVDELLSVPREPVMNPCL